MDILLIANKADLECRLFNKDLLEYNLVKLEQTHKISIFVKGPMKKISPQVEKRLYKANSPIDAIDKFAKDKEDFMVITRLALCDINFENLIKYHNNHDKKVTLVCKNFVKDKSIPIYKLNDKKEIISVTKKRFADAGIYLFKKGMNFKAYKHLYALILDLISKNQIKGFVHKGYWWTTRNIKRRNKDKNFNVS